MKRAAAVFSPRLLLHRLVLRPLLRVFFGVSVDGRENFDGLEHYILIANHNSHLDVLLLNYILPGRDILRTHVVAAREYFSRWRVLFHSVDYLFSPIWIDRVSKDSDPMQAMRERLAAGDNIIIFPEGTRGAPGEIRAFHSGVGRLAGEFPDIPIIPVFLHGPERAFPKSGGFPLPIWNSVTIGPPQHFSGSSAAFVATLETLIRELSGSAVASRHRRAQVKAPPALVAVMGVDGSGKSTLSHSIARQLSAAHEVCLVTDGLEFYTGGRQKDIRPLLAETVRQRIGTYAKHASSLKHYKVPKLAELLLRDYLLGEAGRWYKPDFVIQDGSPLLNLVGWSILYREAAFNREVCLKALKLLSGQDASIRRGDPIFQDFPELLALKRLKHAGMFLPDAVIMLDVNPQVCCQRIAARGERVQPHETAEKLGKMRNGYLRVCEVVREDLGIPVLTLTGDQGMDEVSRLALGFINTSMAEGPAHD